MGIGNFKATEENKNLLITTPSCFVCGETFNSINEYNKHIIHCNKLYKGDFSKHL